MPPPPLSIAGIYGSLRVPTKRDIALASKAYLAIVLSLIVVFSQNLENPYWAALTVYLVLTPPETGAIRSNALFRFLGTIAGGLLMMVVTGLFADQLGVLATVTIFIIVVATYLRQTSRTQLNVLWFSAGTTAGVVGLANLLQPVNVFDYATARSIEISLGIAAITAVDSVFWPRPITQDFLDVMAGWRKQAGQWMADAANPANNGLRDQAQRQALRHGLQDLTKAMATIDARAIQLPFDIVPIAPRRHQLNLVRAQAVAIIADLVAVAKIGVSTAALYPSITLGGSFGTTATSFPDIVQNRAFAWSVGPVISWSFPNVSVARAQVAQANAGARGALAQFDGTVLTALKETETALTALARQLDTERELRLARDDAATANANTASLYAGGIGDFLDTLDTERTQIAAENALASATAAVSKDQIALFMALGGGWQDAPKPVDTPLAAITGPAGKVTGASKAGH